MGWTKKASDFFKNPFRGGAGQAPAAADSSPLERVPRARPEVVRAETSVALRGLFSATQVGGRAAPDGRALSGEQQELAARLSVMVLEHFREHRLEMVSFPAMATQVIELAEQSDVDLGALSHLIERDAAIAGKVLQVANSALYHRGNEIPSIRGAVGHLGMFAVANIAVGVACRSLYDSDTRAEFDLYPKHWKEQFLQSMTVGFATSHFASQHDMERGDHLFLAGMFHDVGKSLALRSLSRLVLDKKVAPCDEAVVDRVLEDTHVAIGVEAHHNWQLPGFMAELCAHHHDDEVPADSEHKDLHALRLVSGLNALRIMGELERPLKRQLKSSVRALGVSQAEVKDLSSDIRDANDRTIEMFGMNA